MLSTAEKAYIGALQALSDKEYRRAAEYFEMAAPQFEGDPDFRILRESTRLLLTVKDELKRTRRREALEIEEVFSNG